jgi:protein-S-isoprenylcysteine O-methyltransferase Ste14
MIEIIATLTIICWTILGVIMLVAGIFTKRTAEAQSIASRLWYGIFLLVAFWLLVKGISDLPAPGVGLKQPIYPLFVSLLPHSSIVMIMGLIITMLGLLIVLWARAILGTNWSGSVTYKEDHELILRGPFAFVRHPIYTGLALMFLGTAITIGNLGGFLGFPVLFISCWIKLKQEETLMIKHFKERYIDYKKRVKALIPFVL